MKGRAFVDDQVDQPRFSLPLSRESDEVTLGTEGLQMPQASSHSFCQALLSSLGVDRSSAINIDSWLFSS